MDLKYFGFKLFCQCIRKRSVTAQLLLKTSCFVRFKCGKVYIWSQWLLKELQVLSHLLEKKSFTGFLTSNVLPFSTLFQTDYDFKGGDCLKQRLCIAECRFAPFHLSFNAVTVVLLTVCLMTYTQDIYNINSCINSENVPLRLQINAIVQLELYAGIQLCYSIIDLHFVVIWR